jgi:nucleotide-binding universal stress UspA family protein
MEADAVVAATNDDDANLEVCRIALDAGVRRIVAVASDPERVPEFRELKVSTFSPDSIAARRVEENLEPRRITSQSFAHGKAEAIEFEVTTRSPVYGKSLRELHARSWVVGAILREGELLIPQGETVLQQGDLVTVVGAGADFTEMVRTFTSGQPRFPLDYGKDVVLAVEPKTVEKALPEACHLVRNSRAIRLLLVHRDEKSIRDEEARTSLAGLLERAGEIAEGVEVHLRKVSGRPARVLQHLHQDESVGTHVLLPSSRRGLAGLFVTSRAVSLARRILRPVLISRGTYPYRRILVPARRTPAGRAAARAAIDLAVRGKASLSALAAIDPIFLAGPGAVKEGRKAMDWLREEAAVLGLSFDGVIKKGNPIRIFLEKVRKADLLVIGVSERRAGRLPVAIVDQLACRAPVSVLLVPVKEKD